MGFAPTSTNLFNNVNDGEAPQLSSTYAEYDDGANVFTNYWNFAGTSLPSGWTADTLTVSVDNGITITGAAGGFLYYSATEYSGNIVVDDYYKIITQASSNGYGEGAVGITTGTSWPADFSVSRTQYNGAGSPYLGYIILGSSVTTTSTGVSTGFKVMSYMGSSLGMEFLHDYSSFETTTSALPSSYYLVGANFDGGSGFLQWLRIRAYPPNDVMPSVSFGSVS